jgi:hypothetical protein
MGDEVPESRWLRFYNFISWLMHEKEEGRSNNVFSRQLITIMLNKMSTFTNSACRQEVILTWFAFMYIIYLNYKILSVQTCLFKTQPVSYQPTTLYYRETTGDYIL